MAKINLDGLKKYSKAVVAEWKGPTGKDLQKADKKPKTTMLLLLGLVLVVLFMSYTCAG